MSLRIVRLGSARHPNEGLRIGTVRRPPRGVSKSDFGRRDFFDVWLPLLAPSEALLHEVKASSSDERSWRTFARKFRSEMKRPDAARTLDLLAALSPTTQLSLGCYCADEARCHRSILRELLSERGATFAAGEPPIPPEKTRQATADNESRQGASGTPLGSRHTAAEQPEQPRDSRPGAPR